MSGAAASSDGDHAPYDPVDDMDQIGDPGEELQELLERQAQLEALAYVPHKCADTLAVRLRTFANGTTHLVKQCLTCGAQRDGPLSRPAAEMMLAGTAAAPFDEEVEDRRRQASIANAAERQRIATRLTQLVDPERARLDAAEQAARDEALARLSAGMLQAVEAVQALASMNREEHLLGELLKHRQAFERAPLHPGSARFRNEGEVRAWLEEWIEEDFDVWREVPGTHLAEQVPVRVDYVLQPKAHLVAAGFKPCFFGVEAKFLPTDHGFSPKASRAVRQAMSYMDAAFDLEGQRIRLQRLVLFTNISFAGERQLLRGIEKHALSNDQAKWVAFLELANHANVGNLEIYGSREHRKGWRIAFATGKYFSRFGAEYELGDPNLFAKVRIGNF